MDNGLPVIDRRDDPVPSARPTGDNGEARLSKCPSLRKGFLCPRPEWCRSRLDSDATKASPVFGHQLGMSDFALGRAQYPAFIWGRRSPNNCLTGRCGSAPSISSFSVTVWPTKVSACRATGKLKINPEAMEKLQALRDRLGKPLIVQSAYCSPEYNRAVGGAPTSKHMQGSAFARRNGKPRSRGLRGGGAGSRVSWVRAHCG